MEVPMLDQKPYHHRWTVASRWIFKAIGLVTAGAATVLIVLTIAKAVSTKSDAPEGGKFVGVRHEAATMPPIVDTRSGVPKSGSDQIQDTSTSTLVRNGVTVVSPQLLVPV